MIIDFLTIIFSYDICLQFDNECITTWYKKGNTLFDLGRNEDALKA